MSTGSLNHFGFTGTRQGMNQNQIEQFRAGLSLRMYLNEHYVFHHGDCVGGDEEAAGIARELGMTIVGHPPVNDEYRARFPSDSEMPPRSYLARDLDIVNAVSVLFVAPLNSNLRGGTWKTFAMAFDHSCEIHSCEIVLLRRQPADV